MQLVFDTRELDDLRLKVRLFVAVIAFVALPSAVLFVIGLPGWIVWPVFVLLFTLVGAAWLASRFFGFTSRFPGLFFAVPHKKTPTSPTPPTPEVVEVSPELEAALWNEWMDRARRRGGLGEVVVGMLRAVGPFVGAHVQHDPDRTDIRS